MKRFIVLAVSTVALMAGNAYAGGCLYGEHAEKIAEGDAPILAEADEIDPKVLAKIKEQRADSALEKLLETPIVHN